MTGPNIFGLREYSRKDLFECTTDEIREADRFYIMHEADNVIREQVNAANRLRDNMEQAIRRYKYKHCLDMAYKCAVLCQKSKDRYRWAEDENLEHYYNRKIEFFARWHNRWLKIAEHFKEAK